MLTRDEGLRRKPYLDSTNHVSIGIGRNLTDKGVSGRTIDQMFQEDLDEAFLGAKDFFPDMDSWTPARQMAVINMVFNLGSFGFEKFKATRAAIERGDWDEAADHALNSKWATQVHGRSLRVAYMLRTGEIPDDYTETT